MGNIQEQLNTILFQLISYFISYLGFDNKPQKHEV